jgi:hypothetical protein
MTAIAQPLTTTAMVGQIASRAEIIAFCLMLAVFAIAPMFVYPLFLMNALCFAMFACAFNLLIGYGGLLSFGHALYFGWGSYLSAYSAKVWHLPPELAILTGTAMAAILGIISGALAIRRHEGAQSPSATVRSATSWRPSCCRRRSLASRVQRRRSSCRSPPSPT